MDSFSEGKKALVAIQCTAYNHSQYIRQTLDGFVQQKTNFPFVAIVHDDASTDGTDEIIKEYAKKYPDIILPIYEKENQYSKHDGTLRKIMNDACDALGVKYIALCEGDDYWIDPLKLQKQVDFLESHKNYSMCVTNSWNLEHDTLTPSKWNVKNDRDLSIEEIILNGGLFIATASLVFRRSIHRELPDETIALHVGDYPLQIFMAYKGNVRMLADNTCVYRIASTGSWTEKIKKNQFDYSKVSTQTQKEMFLLDTMDRLTNYKYTDSFKKRKNLYSYNANFFFKATDCLKYFIKDPATILANNSAIHILLSFLPKGLKQRKFK